MRSFMRYFSLAVFVFAIATCAWAQEGSITGSVRDSSGAVIPNAKVTLKETDTGSTRGTETNASGNYAFPDLPPGSRSRPSQRPRPAAGCPI